MVRVCLEGHESYYGISDVLRLFYSGVKENKEEGQVIAEGGPDITIISKVTGDDVYTYLKGSRQVTSDLEKIDIKREVKRSLYAFLCEYTGIKMPWGCLTGIRPTVVASEEMYNSDKLVSKYLVREDKAVLASYTGRNEEKCLEVIPKEDINVYVGVPFCPSRCEYCSFISRDALHHLDILGEYASAVAHETEIIGRKLEGKREISTLYIGGGTPTVFDDKTFAFFLESVIKNLPISNKTEITVEAGRPDTITEYKLHTMKDLGIKRICINPQTMKTETLMKLNRKHTVEDVIRVYEEAKKYGFEIINMDLIAGLKYEIAEDFVDSVKRVLALKPQNVTVHTLYKKRRSDMSLQDVLDFEGTRGSLDDAVKEGYELIMEAGYVPYYMYRQKDTGHGLENVGFALPGTECLYNVAMMTDKRDVLSFGAGGMSKRIFDAGRYERCSCTKDIHSYIRETSRYADKKIEFFEL